MNTRTLLYIFLLSLLNLPAGFAQSNAGLVAHWRFNGNAGDSSGNAHHGTATNISYTTGRKGKPNTAASFDGSSSYIAVGYQSDLNLTSYAICATIKSGGFYTGPCQTNAILWRGNQYASPNYGLMFTDNVYDADCNITDTTRNVFVGFAGANAGNANQLKYSPNVSSNVWYSVVANYTNDTVRLYVDGILKSTYRVTSGPITSSTDGLWIGADYNSTSSSYPFWFKGVMDDIRLYNRVLADTEVQQYYADLYLDSPVLTQLCKTVPFNLSYKIQGVYNSGNVFTAQLSNSSGSFASPTILGSNASTAAGFVTCTVPSGVALGSGYKMRIVSSSPVKISEEADVSVHLPATPPSIYISVAPSTVVVSGSSVFFSAVPSNGGSTPSYQWRKNKVHIPGATGITYSAVAGVDFADKDTIDCVLRSSTVCATPD